MPTPEVSRRAVLKGAGVLGAAAAATVAGSPVAHADALPLKASAFETLVGEQFAFCAPGRSSVTLLLEAVEATDSRGPADEDAFVLRFSGPPAEQQGGEVGTLSAPDHRATSLLVVPGAMTAANSQEWIVTVMNRHRHD